MLLRVAILGLVSVLISTGAVGTQRPAGGSPAQSETVHKSGQVEAGIEGGCLVIRDQKDHKLYNVLFRGTKKPRPGEEISFRGTIHQGPNTCMEGIAVDVTAWKPAKTAPHQQQPNSP